MATPVESLCNSIGQVSAKRISERSGYWVTAILGYANHSIIHLSHDDLDSHAAVTIRLLLAEDDESSVDILELLIEPMTTKQLLEQTGLSSGGLARMIYDLLSAMKIERRKDGREFVYVRII